MSDCHEEFFAVSVTKVTSDLGAMRVLQECIQLKKMCPAGTVLWYV